MPKTKDSFRITKSGKPVLDKVSVKLLMTPAERIMFDIYSEKTEVDKTAIATKAVNSFIRGDGYFKKVLARSPKLKELIANAKPLGTVEKKVKVVKAIKAKAKPKAKKHSSPKPKFISPEKPFGTL